MRSFKFVIFVAALGLAACSGGFGSAGETIDSGTEAVGPTADEASPDSQMLGSYQAHDGTLLGLVLARRDGNNVFVADQQVWCFKAPCFPIHLEGSWAVRSGTLHLTENANKHVFEYTLADDVLTLADPSDHRRVGSLAKVATWCGQTSQCTLQVVSQPRSSVGGVVCQADQTCGAYAGDAAGLGDSCGDGVTCLAGLTCQDDVCGQ